MLDEAGLDMSGLGSYDMDGLGLYYYLVTVTLPKRLDHNPKMKQTGSCRIHAISECTDKTGEHHTLLVDASGPGLSLEIKKYFEDVRSCKVTRIEEVVRVFLFPDGSNAV